MLKQDGGQKVLMKTFLTNSFPVKHSFLKTYLNKRRQVSLMDSFVNYRSFH